MPTLNGFDNGDVRATTLVLRMREGKPGGGKVPLISEDRSLTLATANDQTLFIFSHTQGLDAQPSEEASPTLRANGGGMAVAYDEFNDSVGETHHTLRAGTKQSTGVVTESIVRRLTPLECERLQGFPDNWTEGQTDTNRYKQLGNAVAVPVVEWLMEGIVSNS